MITLSPRFGLTLWGADSDIIQREQWTDAMEAIDSLAAIAQSGPVASRPAAGQFGRFWYDPSNSTGEPLSFDNGTVWVPVLTRVDTDVLAANRPNPGQEGLYVYEKDQNRLFRDNGSKWVEIITSTLMPAGTLLATMTATQPTGWLFCDGSTYSTATYPDLFEAIGYRFGGSGKSFKVPNLHSQLLMGGPNTGSIGGKGSAGEVSVPAHYHGVPVPLEQHIHVGYLADHDHSYSAPTPATTLEVQLVGGIEHYSTNLTGPAYGYTVDTVSTYAGGFAQGAQIEFLYCNYLIKTTN